MKVAVIGATGYVGGRLVPELLEAGHDVRCLARTPPRLDAVPWRDLVEVVRADVLEPDSLEDGFAGVDAVYHLVHAMGHAGDFETTDRLGAGHVRDAAAKAEVQRIVYLGGLGEDDPAKLSQHLASRHEVGEVLASGPVAVTELRAAVIIGSGSASFEMLRNLSEVLPIMVCPRWVTRTRCQPSGIADVLYYLVAVLEHPETAGRVLDVGGPDVLTYRDMMDRYAEVAGLRRRIVIRVPVLSPRLSSHWVNLVTPLPYGLARPLVESLINDVVVDPDRDVRRWIDHEPIGLDEALRRALRQVKDLKVSTSWMDSATKASPATPSPHDPSWAGGTVLENRQEVTTSAPPEAVFAAVSGVGGNRGWYATTGLWMLRGWVDKLIGGVGMRRGRRHPDDLRVGDALDFFRVEDHDRPRLLRLRAEMRLPGDAWLEWTIDPHAAGGSTLRQLARFHPRGIAGRLYWWAMLPFHTVIFDRLARNLVAVAEEADAATE